MRKLFLFLLIFVVVYAVITIYSVDKYYFICPIDYNGNVLIRSDARGDGFFAAKRNGGRLHQGVDLFAPLNTPVIAVRSGRVVAAEKSNGMGNYVKLQHPEGILTLYGHLTRIYVRKNQLIRQGQVIGTVGKTGNANHPDIQPHLHFEVRKNNIHQDPMGYLN